MLAAHLVAAALLVSTQGNLMDKLEPCATEWTPLRLLLLLLLLFGPLE